MKLSRNVLSIVVGVTIAAAMLVAVLAHVFSGSWVLPQFFSLGPITIHYYGITMALAVGSAWWLASRRASGYGLTQEQVDTLSLWLVVGGFIGARLYHVASSFRYYAQYPTEAIQVWHGGLSIFGALIGGFVVVLFFVAHKAKRGKAAAPEGSAYTQHSAFNILHLLDWLAPSVLLGQIFGRFGNFFNYEAFGYPTNLPWKMFVPTDFRPGAFLHVHYFHPLFLYEALGNAIILAVLLYRYSVPAVLSSTRRPVAPGVLFFSYLILYNVLRFALEHMRTDSTFFANGMRLNSVVSGALVVVGIAGVLLARRLAKPRAV